MNAELSARLRPASRCREILVYGRPSVLRNAFELICDGLVRWQQSDPVRASQWRVVFVGEDFPAAWAAPVQNYEVAGKLSLSDYAQRLSRASVGVSLMLSPHPSYPPLEMAEAGLITVVNQHDGKDLIRRFSGFISLASLDGEMLAEAIETAIDRAEPCVGQMTGRNVLRRPALKPGVQFDAVKLAAEIRADATSTTLRKYAW